MLLKRCLNYCENRDASRHAALFFLIIKLPQKYCLHRIVSFQDREALGSTLDQWLKYLDIFVVLLVGIHFPGAGGPFLQVSFYQSVPY